MVSIRGKSAAIALVMLVLGATGPVAIAATESDRAMWVWEGPESGVVDFAVANGVTTVYLSTPPGFSSDASHTAFLEEAHHAGLVVFATAGDPSWAKKPSPLYQWVAEVVEHGGFDGIIVDVEPYLHADWTSTKKRDRLIANYLRGLEGASRRAGALPFVAAVPFWFDDPSFAFQSELLVVSVLDRVDGIMVMAYRDHADGVDGIVEHASAEVNLAAERGKTAVIGVETGATTLDKTTFAEEGLGALEAALAETVAAFAGHAGFGGVSIHHYGAWQTLSP